MGFHENILGRFSNAAAVEVVEPWNTSLRVFAKRETNLTRSRNGLSFAKKRVCRKLREN